MSDASRADASGCARFPDDELRDDFDGGDAVSPAVRMTIDRRITVVPDDRVSAPSAAHFVIVDGGACNFMRAQRVVPRARERRDRAPRAPREVPEHFPRRRVDGDHDAGMDRVQRGGGRRDLSFFWFIPRIRDEGAI